MQLLTKRCPGPQSLWPGAAGSAWVQWRWSLPPERCRTAPLPHSSWCALRTTSTVCKGDKNTQTAWPNRWTRSFFFFISFLDLWDDPQLKAGPNMTPSVRPSPFYYPTKVTVDWIRSSACKCFGVHVCVCSWEQRKPTAWSSSGSYCHLLTHADTFMLSKHIHDTHTHTLAGF